MTRLIAALALLLCLAAPAVAAPYAVEAGKTCDGWPRAPIEMAPGLCAGIVVQPPPGRGLSIRKLRLPRTLVQLKNGDWIVADLGGWDPEKGSVWRMRAERGKPPVLTPLLRRLTMPHGLAIGPDGKVYVGEMSRIIRFDPNAADPAATVEVVVSGLPDNRLHDNRHPLSNFIFDADWSLLVNVGAPTDQCVVKGRPVAAPCPERDGPDALAAVRRYRYLGGGRWDLAFETFARGLRNSLALARTPAGTILQAENSYDFAPAQETPFEELNVLSPGADYGWPYCFDLTATTAVWRGRSPLDCRSPAHAKPALLLPPHAAPLGMTVYDGAMFPQLKGRLLISYHGYRATGGRVVAFTLDGKGLPVATKGARYPARGADGKTVWRPYPGPAAEPLELTPGWNAVKGKRPMGAPVGLAVAADGAIWLADDRNGHILRISADRP